MISPNIIFNLCDVFENLSYIQVLESNQGQWQHNRLFWKSLLYPLPKTWRELSHVTHWGFHKYSLYHGGGNYHFQLHISIIYMPVHVNTIIPYHIFSLFICVYMYMFICIYIWECIYEYGLYGGGKMQHEKQHGKRKGFLFIIILYFIIHHPGKSD